MRVEPLSRPGHHAPLQALSSLASLPRVSRSAGALVTSLVVLSGCSGRAGAPSAWTVTRDTLPSGAVRVTNTPPTGSPAPDRVLEENLRIGTREGQGPAQFGAIMGLAVLSDGRIAVLDGQAKQVRLFDRTGAYLESFGGEGQGPGELEVGWGLMRDRRDRLWVPDYRNARMSVFDPDSGFLRSFPMKISSYGYFWSGAMLADGRIVELALVPSGFVLRVYGRDMNQVDSALLAKLPPEPANPGDSPNSFVWTAPDRSRAVYITVPFYPLTRRAFGPSGDVWSSPPAGDPSYRITRGSLDGDTAVVLETKRPPVPVSPAERDSAIQSIRAQFADYSAHVDLDWSKIPRVRPAISGMFVSESGQLWVRTPATSTGVRFDVYARDGSHLRTVETSRAIAPQPPPIVRGDTLWAVVKDAVGVQYVVRGTIRAAGGMPRAAGGT